MFWKLIRWGGTVLVLLLVLAAIILGKEAGDSAAPVRPGDAQTQANKNFNF